MSGNALGPSLQLHFTDACRESFSRQNLCSADFCHSLRCLSAYTAAAGRGKRKDQDSPKTSASRSLLTGLLYCADCGSKLCFTHNTTRRHLADGNIRVHERDLYRCYRKISAPDSCKGQRVFLAQIREIPEEDLLQLSASRKQEVCEVALKQARSDYDSAKR